MSKPRRATQTFPGTTQTMNSRHERSIGPPMGLKWGRFTGTVYVLSAFAAKEVSEEGAANRCQRNRACRQSPPRRGHLCIGPAFQLDHSKVDMGASS